MCLGPAKEVFTPEISYNYLELLQIFRFDSNKMKYNI